METKEKNVLKEKGGVSKIKIVLIVTAVLAVLIATITVFISTKSSSNNEPKVHTVSESSLREVFEISELQTVDYIYNAIAKKLGKDDEVEYHVAYEGTVKVGIDFEKIDINIYEEDKKIVIVLPEAEIFSTEVNPGTMEYIFTKKKYETEEISQEAYKLCLDDLKNSVEGNEALIDSAVANSKSIVEAFIKPWVESFDDGYTVEIM